MALGIQTQMGTRESYASKCLASKNAFAQLIQQVSPMVEKGLISKSVSNGTTSKKLLEGKIDYKKVELKEFSILESMLEENINANKNNNEQVDSVQVSGMLAQLVKNNAKEKEEDLSM